MSNPNIVRYRGGKADRPSKVRHQSVRSEVSDVRSDATRFNNPTITALHCDDAMRHADEVYIAEYADQGATETIVAGADDRSLTNALGIRFRKPEVEVEPIQTRIYSREHGRMIVPLTLPNRLTWKTDSTLLNRGTFKRTTTDKLKRATSRSGKVVYDRLPDDDPATVYIRDTPEPKPEPATLPSVYDLAAKLQSKFQK